MQVYVAPDVADVEALHPYLADGTFRALPIREQLGKQAETVRAAHGAGDRRIRMHLMSWWPGARGKTLDQVMAARFSLDDAMLTICREYGFDGVQGVAALGDAAPDGVFEQAVDEMLAGNLSNFKSLLQREPHLATARSAFGHRSTLLHYVGANGVESTTRKVKVHRTLPLMYASLADRQYQEKNSDKLHWP